MSYSQNRLLDQDLKSFFDGSLMSEANERQRVDKILSSSQSNQEKWCQISKLVASQPFETQFKIFQQVYASDEVAPVWVPTGAEISKTRAMKFASEIGCDSFARLQQYSQGDRESFFKIMTEKLEVKFHRRPSATWDLSGGVSQPKWWPGAKLNIAESCFSANGDAVAIKESGHDGKIHETRFSELRALANRYANTFTSFGLKKGDSVGLCMVMNTDAVACYLGCVLAGLTVVGVADSFAKDELALRFKIANAKLVLTQATITRMGKRIELYSKVKAASDCPVWVYSDNASETLAENDAFVSKLLSADVSFESVSCDPLDTLNILFSSGTTAEPKAIPWNHVTPMKCAIDGYFHHDVLPEETLAWPTSLGWMMGPWLIFAAFLNRANIALYTDAPTTQEFLQFCADAKVAMLGVVPSLVKVWLQRGLLEDADFSHLRRFSSTGECSSSLDMHKLTALAGYKPVIEYCGGTEVGGGYICGSMCQPQVAGAFSSKAMGLDFLILDESGKPANTGEVFISPPSMGLSLTLLNRDHHQVYYEGAPKGPNGEVLRRHGDYLEALADGYFKAQGRADDTMNLGGIKVSSAEIERVLNGLDGVVETAAIAVAPMGGGPSELIVYTVTEKAADEILPLMQKAVKSKLNPLFKITDVKTVASLPRTASNKVMRRRLRQEFLETKK